MLQPLVAQSFDYDLEGVLPLSLGVLGIHPESLQGIEIVRTGGGEFGPAL